MITETPDCRIGGINGPFSNRPSGKWNKSGSPIMRKCQPYYTVDYMHGNVRMSQQFVGKASAQEFLDSLSPCDLV